MLKKITLIGFAVLAFGLARANAGTEMVEPERAPAPSYNYAPPPRVYYAPPPPPPPVVVYPAFGYYAPRVRVFAYHRVIPRRVYCPPHRRP
ncbi:MAG: hypothetical protein H0X73_07605 [Chthoniobacterales bacterium]|nr:hypothetical protein [Chthoniobacterales bacterium]